MSSPEKPINDLDNWIPLAEVGLIGMSPIFTKGKPFSILHRKQMKDKRIVLNVSGRKFETWDYTLKKYPTTLLGSSDRESFYDSEKKEYFFERDSSFFRHILNYYRYGKLHFSLEECGEFYENELEFFRIPTEALGLCCLEEFHDANSAATRESPSAGETSHHCECAPQRKTFRQRLWFLFENPQSSTKAKVVYYIIGIAIVLSIITTITETIPCGDKTCGEKYKEGFQYLDGTCVVILTLEYLIRLFAAPQRCKFVKEFQSIVDLAAVIPFYLDIGLKSAGDFDALTILRVFRVFRVFKMSRHSTRLQALGSSIKNSSSELGFILFSFGLGVIIFATAVYYAEKDVKGTTFSSIPDSMWYAIVTMTTTGYVRVCSSLSYSKAFAFSKNCCRAFSRYVTRAILVFQNKEIAAISVSQDTPFGVEL